MIKPTGKYGYTDNDIKKLCKEKKIPIKLFWKAFGRGNTCAIDEKGNSNYYVCDVEKALYKLGDKDGADWKRTNRIQKGWGNDKEIIAYYYELLR